ncbi:MAG TPA: Fe(2+)-trafficking protein [Tepidisphaeraceae bacterium]|nr:Fe(2+)-trafficking protein [Tepidisphaeraceae bacterium]
MADPRIDQFRRMTQDAPNDPLGHFSLGKALLDGGDAAEAAKSLQRVVALDPNLSKAYQLLGQAQLKTGHREYAVQTLTDGIAIAHRRGDALVKSEIERMLADLGSPVPQFAAPGADAAAVGEGEVLCLRHQGPGPKLPKPPFRNDFGREVFEHTCANCWQDAIRHGTKVINELRLPLSDPQAQRVWDEHIREFLNLKGAS